MQNGKEASWLADGVREIERVVKASMVVEPRLIELPHERKGTYGVVTPGPAGTDLRIDTRVAGPGWHSEQLETPDELVKFIKSMSERGVEAGKSAVYVGRNRITYVFDFEDRRQRATCPLIVSQPFKWLLTPPNPLSQRDIVRAMRITFAGALLQDSQLVDVLRNVKWKSSGELEANMQKGKEALGRQILNEAAGIDRFPDEFVLHVRVYENAKPVVQVRAALEILPEMQKFEVLPFPNELQTGIELALMNIQDQIAGQTKVPTFIGRVAAKEADAE